MAIASAAVAWGAFFATESTLRILSRQSLPLMTKAIELQSKVSTYAADLVRFGQVQSDAERNAQYLAIMDASSQIDDSIYDVSETLAGKSSAKGAAAAHDEKNAALEKMMDIGATLATSVTAVNNAVVKGLQLGTERVR